MRDLQCLTCKPIHMQCLKKRAPGHNILIAGMAGSIAFNVHLAEDQAGFPTEDISGKSMGESISQAFF